MWHSVYVEVIQHVNIEKFLKYAEVLIFTDDVVCNGIHVIQLCVALFKFVFPLTVFSGFIQRERFRVFFLGMINLRARPFAAGPLMTCGKQPVHLFHQDYLGA